MDGCPWPLGLMAQNALLLWLIDTAAADVDVDEDDASDDADNDNGGCTTPPLNIAE